jgi:hypothetical protein
MTTTSSEAATAANTEEIWYAPSSSGTPACPKIGPGDPSSDPRVAHPWNVLAFVRGFLTIDTTDKHYPEWRKWLDYSASGSGLRIVTQAQRDAIEHVATDAEWADLEARHAAAVALRR